MYQPLLLVLFISLLLCFEGYFFIFSICFDGNKKTTKVTKNIGITRPQPGQAVTTPHLTSTERTPHIFIRLQTTQIDTVLLCLLKKYNDTSSLFRKTHRFSFTPHSKLCTVPPVVMWKANSPTVRSRMEMNCKLHKITLISRLTLLRKLGELLQGWSALWTMQWVTSPGRSKP